jgi:hypothetical protein
VKRLKRFDLGADSSDEMTTIRTTCPRCGEVDMGPEAILLSVRENGREGSYRFRCPSCADRVEKRADRKIVALLVSAGVDIERNDGGTLQAEAGLFDHEEIEGPANPELAPDGPSLSVDDLIEFHYLLEDDRYIQDFLATQ